VKKQTFEQIATHAAVTGRIVSIDIFRGLTVLVMVFVDNLAFVKGLPWWTHHMPAGNNGMTYVDMVFPAFLFVMGMSIPLAVDRRVAAGGSRGRIWLHHMRRSLSLVVLGLFIANAPQVDLQHTGIGAVWWAALGFIGIALFWGVQHSPSANSRLHRVTKYAGLMILAGLFITFRRITPGGQLAWLDFSDWEILGLLGWAYLLVSSLYLLLKKNLVALTASLVLLSALNALSTAGWLGWLRRLPPYAQPFEAGLSSITMAGLIACLIIVEGKIPRNFRAKILWASVYALVLAGAACLLTPLGISKLRDTPAWCLYCGSKHHRAAVPPLDSRYWLRGKEDQVSPTNRDERTSCLHAGLHRLLQYDAVSPYRGWYGGLVWSDAGASIRSPGTRNNRPSDTVQI
jgi:heparan-alpha-glucosaminide N-acetyltransferase